MISKISVSLVQPECSLHARRLYNIIFCVLKWRESLLKGKPSRGELPGYLVFTFAVRFELKIPVEFTKDPKLD